MVGLLVIAKRSMVNTFFLRSQRTFLAVLVPLLVLYLYLFRSHKGLYCRGCLSLEKMTSLEVVTGGVKVLPKRMMCQITDHTRRIRRCGLGS